MTPKLGAQELSRTKPKWRRAGVVNRRRGPAQGGSLATAGHCEEQQPGSDDQCLLLARVERDGRAVRSGPSVAEHSQDPCPFLASPWYPQPLANAWYTVLLQTPDTLRPYEVMERLAEVSPGRMSPDSTTTFQHHFLAQVWVCPPRRGEDEGSLQKADECSPRLTGQASPCSAAAAGGEGERRKRWAFTPQKPCAFTLWRPSRRCFVLPDDSEARDRTA